MSDRWDDQREVAKAAGPHSTCGCVFVNKDARLGRMIPNYAACVLPADHNGMHSTEHVRNSGFQWSDPPEPNNTKDEST